MRVNKRKSLIFLFTACDNKQKEIIVKEVAKINNITNNIKRQNSIKNACIFIEKNI